jgi:DNA-directed RNA polymerase specialized sigma24 family protein
LLGVSSPDWALASDNQTMPVLSAHQIVLCAGQRQLLLARARRASGEHRDVLRARIVLAAAGGAPNAAIARSLGVTDDTVRTWWRRFWTVFVIGHAPAGRVASPPRWLLR